MKTSKGVFRLCLSVVVFCTGMGCTGEHPATVYQKGDKEYGTVSGAFFRHRWWNYYERGLSFVEGAFYEEAIGDLNEALRQRDRDQRMARTYGMHFIDYFPHRELGIIYYEMGNLEAAKGELELSLSQYPSAKASFYLDRVRKALIEGEAKEVAPPKLTLDLKALEVWTRDDPVALSGVAADENYVAALTIGGMPFFLEGSTRRVRFEKNLILSQGRHDVEVKATNLLGKVATQRVTIHVDREGPTVVLDELDADTLSLAHEVTVRGSLYDETGVTELIINGEAVRIQEGREVHFSHRLGAPADTLEVLARDRLGNETSAHIPLRPPPSGQAPWLIARVDFEGNVLADMAFLGSSDSSPPIIQLKGWTDTQTVFLEKAYLEGQVTDQRKIVRLTINQASILRGKGPIVFFSHIAELREGENTITLEAEDEVGNTAIKKISVIRRVPKAMQMAERLSLTVLPFEHRGEVSDASFSFRDNLIDSLVAQNRFRVIERDKLDVILKEQEISRSKLIDRSTALKVGKLAAAESIVVGSIVETRTGIEIVSRMIDTETSDIVATADVYGEVRDLPALRHLAQGMAIKLHRDFPMVDGIVLEQKGKDIVTDLGENAVKLYRKVIVYREKPVKHPVTGKFLGSDNEVIGRARVTQVLPKMSKAEVVTGKAGAIEPQDKVMTE